MSRRNTLSARSAELTRTPAGWRLRLAIACVYASVFLVALALAQAVPIVPLLAQRYRLDSVTSAVLLASPSVAVVFLSLPAGRLSDRIGARRATLIAAGLLSGSCVAQSSPSLWAIVAGRLGCGAAFALVWSAALAWLAQLHAVRGGKGAHIGATVTGGSVGSAVGPTVSGALVGVGGPGLPFVLAAIAAGVVVTALLIVGRIADGPLPVAATRTQSSRPDASLQLALPATGASHGHLRHPHVVYAAASALAMSGAVGGVVQLLVPLQLHALGASPAKIGLALSGASLLYIAVSAAVVRAGSVATNLRVNALAVAMLVVSLVPAVVGAGLWWFGSVLFLSAIPRATIGTVAYPIAALGARSEAMPTATIFALLNTLWAAAMVVAPIVAGLVSQLFGLWAGYVLAGCMALPIAGWLIVSRPRHCHPAD